MILTWTELVQLTNVLGASLFIYQGEKTFRAELEKIVEVGDEISWACGITEVSTPDRRWRESYDDFSDSVSMDMLTPPEVGRCHQKIHFTVFSDSGKQRHYMIRLRQKIPRHMVA